jgi:tetratricopeptide (TPR) repeat protein
VEVYRQRRLSQEHLDRAGRETDRGNYESALALIDEAHRLAAGTDDPPTLIRARLSLGNVFTHLGRGGEAAAAYAEALSEAEKAGDTELAAICRIHIARGRLLAALAGEADAQAVSREVLSQALTELKAVKTDPPSAALAWICAGLARKELRLWSASESALKNALDIHTKGQYLEQAAYDWYLIASVRSVAGQYDSALEALNSALLLDRRAENSYGLGMDWIAIGDVHKKAPAPAKAAQAYRRAAGIFRAAGYEQAALEAEHRQE